MKKIDYKKRVWYFLGSLVGIIIVLRGFLAFFPHTNFDIKMFNVHHMYTGGFLLVVAMVFFLFEIVNKYTLILVGVSSGLVLDEIVYLIATDGSDFSYLTPVSFWGMVVFVGIIVLFVGGMYYGKYKKIS